MKNRHGQAILTVQPGTPDLCDFLILTDDENGGLIIAFSKNYMVPGFSLSTPLTI